MPGDSPADRFRESWSRVAAALAADDEDDLLSAVQDWIGAWDECFWSNDFSPFEIAYHPEVEIVNSTRFKGLSPVRDGSGIQLFQEGRNDVVDVASWFRFVITSVERDDNRLLAMGSIRARGRYSRILLRFPFAAIWTLEDDRICRVEGFSSRRKAVATFETARTSIAG